MTNSTPSGMAGASGAGTTTGKPGTTNDAWQAGLGDEAAPRTQGIGDDASTLAKEAKGAGRRVADVAKEETGAVASETRIQARRLAGDVGHELREQAAAQQTRVASGLRSVGSGFSSMADGATEKGVATDLVREAGQRVDCVAQWLDRRDPASLLHEVKTFARRRPGVFLAIAVGAGVVVGRLTRALATPPDDSGREASGRSDDDGAHRFTESAGVIDAQTRSASRGGL